MNTNNLFLTLFLQAFPGIINWQKRLWLLINEFNEIRTNDIDIGIDIIKTPEFEEQETKMFDARNYYIKGTTFNYMFSHQLSVALSKMQGLTNSLRVNEPFQIYK